MKLSLQLESKSPRKISPGAGRLQVDGKYSPKWVFHFLYLGFLFVMKGYAPRSSSFYSS